MQNIEAFAVLCQNDSDPRSFHGVGTCWGIYIIQPKAMKFLLFVNGL